jgi:hypothetical protein
MNMTLDDVADVLGKASWMTAADKDKILADLRDSHPVLIGGLPCGDILLEPQGDGLWAAYARKA